MYSAVSKEMDAEAFVISLVSKVNGFGLFDELYLMVLG